MQRRGKRSRSGAVVAMVVATALAACGGGGSGASSRTPERVSGSAVFRSAGCGSCHTLAAAHASGHVGPNLDRLKPSMAEVEHQVRVGGGAMPTFARSLSSEQIRAVAKYVNQSTHRKEGP